jgi:PAS domain S-box-containing protein
MLVNTALLQILGRRRQDLIGLHPGEYLDGDDAAAVARHNARVLEQGKPLTFDEPLSSDGSRPPFVVTRFPVRDHTGVIRYIGVSARDDSMERELNSRLQGVQRVEILGRLAAGVAHDLNNLLTAVVGNTALLLESAPRPEEEQQMLRDISQAGEGAARLTQRLLGLGRGPPIGRTEGAEVDGVLRELEPLLRVLVRSNVQLRLQPGAPGAQVAVDPTAVGQIVLNLVSNARDAIPSDGTITIDTAEVPFAGGRGVRLRVSDTGTGMDAQTLERIFEPFFTTKDESRGSGIGLYTVDAIVRQAEGEITATSTPGAGTVFTVDLPVAP